MAMGTRKQREKQEDIWIAHTALPSSPGHPFYQRLNGCGHAAAMERPRGGAFLAVYLLLTRRENRNRLSGSRISISCTKSVTESRSSTRSSARLVVPKISYFHPGLLRHRCSRINTGNASAVSDAPH